MKKKVVPRLRKEVKVKVDIVTTDDIKIYYTGKFQDFTATLGNSRISLQSLMQPTNEVLLYFYSTASCEV